MVAANSENSQRAQRESTALFRASVTFILIAGAVWLTLYVTFVTFPYLRSGSDIVVEEKLRTARHGGLLPQSVPVRVVVFGNSKTLAGFMPDMFDTAFSGRAVSYNLGLPGVDSVTDSLEALLKGGDRPTHVLIQTDWRGADGDKGLIGTLRDDHFLIKQLFPFRTLPRDVTLFLFASLHHGGPAKTYAANRAEIAKVTEARGWFFIASQSHFPGDRLPDGYTLPTDMPQQANPRQLTIEGPGFKRLQDLADRYKFKVILIPSYVRVNEFAAPAPANAELASMLAKVPGFSAAGPDYWRYPNSLFSDPVHVNVEGAHRYTSDLISLLRPQLESAVK